MQHNHNHTCLHPRVAFCRHCNTVYCNDCNQEWSPKVSYTATYTYPWNTSGTFLSQHQNAQLANSLYKSAAPLTTQATCSHDHKD